MGAETDIEWADATWNPWQGCTPVSEGCENCYMYAAKKRYGQDPTVVKRSSDKTFNMPLSLPAGQRVFVCSWSDFLHSSVVLSWMEEALTIMGQRPDLTFMMLTKREAALPYFISTMRAMRQGRTWSVQEGWPENYHGQNIWIGCTAENQYWLNIRAKALRQIGGHVRFLSFEPLLGPIDASHALDYSGHEIDWVIVGAETGPKARPMNPDWARSVRDQCGAAGVPFFFKKMSGGAYIPEDLMVREFPKNREV